MGSKTAILAGIAGAFVLGVWAGPQLTDRTEAVGVAAVESPPAPVAAPEPAPRPVAARRTPRAAEIPDVAPTAPALQARLQPLLTSGSNMQMAAEGFTDAEQFATIVHASRNTQVPFVLLKDRVLNKRRPLAKAIAEFKPDLNGEIEAERAKAEARSSLSRLGRS
jgi:hypothetical protein